VRLPGRRAEDEAGGNAKPRVTDPTLPNIVAELARWETAGLIAGGWQAAELDAQVAGMLGELRNHLSPADAPGVEPRWFLITRTDRGVRSVRVFDHEDPARTAFESEERWAKANPEHGVQCALFGASHLSQIVVAHSTWFDPAPAGPPPTPAGEPADA
jgi:hypothetical protein